MPERKRNGNNKRERERERDRKTDRQKEREKERERERERNKGFHQIVYKFTLRTDETIAYLYKCECITVDDGDPFLQCGLTGVLSLNKKLY